MKTQPSSVAGVELAGPDAPGFLADLERLLGQHADGGLRGALPYSVIARNRTGRTIALLGVRFDMLGRNARPYSVVHYADTLRHPESADLVPGAIRFVCAEPAYTAFVAAKGERPLDPRAAMNLENLHKAAGIKASIDCVAFVDGQFMGPDSLGSLMRFERERVGERELVTEVLSGQDRIGEVLAERLEEAGSRALAKQFYGVFQSGGAPEVMARARNHRFRIRLWR
jgi:hypothetical protein